MRVEVTFGVKSSSLEEARRFVEHASGLPAEARESSDWGGDYYAFGARESERLRLFNNKDVYEDEPVRNFPEWTILLLANFDDSASPILKALGDDREHFEKLEAHTF